MEPNSTVVDITDFAPAEKIQFEIRKPGGVEGTGWIIELLGPAHDKAVKWQNDKQRLDLRRQHQLEQQQANGRKVKVDERQPEDVRRENVSWVVSRIGGWTPVKIGFFSPDPIPFSDETATKLFMDPRMNWAFVQLVDAITDERNFSKASATI